MTSGALLLSRREHVVYMRNTGRGSQVTPLLTCTGDVQLTNFHRGLVELDQRKGMDELVPVARDDRPQQRH